MAIYAFVNFQIEPELGAGIDPGMAFTLFPSSILDETRFEPTTFRDENKLTIRLSFKFKHFETPMTTHQLTF
jgi:hypothetical protein